MQTPNPARPALTHLDKRTITNAVFLLLVLHSVSPAQWSTNPNQNNPISIAPNDQIIRSMVSDGSGGAIMVWDDSRRGSGLTDIYAQRIDVSGLARWTTNGVEVAIGMGLGAGFSQATTDGDGGVIIAWQDRRINYSQIYARSVDSAGVVLWTEDGVAISTNLAEHDMASIASDNAGGAIIVYRDTRTDGDIYAQRVNQFGQRLWPVNSDTVVVAAGTQSHPVIISDGAGGAIVAWRDQRSGADDVYVQRLSATGVRQWSANGVAICTAAGLQYNLKMTSDGAGGAIITWQDERSGTSDIYAQRVDSSGSALWTANGVPICTAAEAQTFPAIAGDGANGAIITWMDFRPTTYYQIYAQRVNAAGNIQWAANGVILSPTIRSQINPSIAGDGIGGAIIAWSDVRVGLGNYDVYAQRINGSGAVQWTSAGAAISTAPQIQSGPLMVGSSGGAIMAWNDFRNSPGSNIYAQRVRADGALFADLFALVSPQAGFQWVAGTDTAIIWTVLPGLDSVDIHYRTDTSGAASVFHQIVSNYPAGSGRFVWSIPDTILSRRCAIRIQQSSNGILVDTSKFFTIKGYELHRFRADSNYERFRFERDRWNFGNTSANMWPPAWYGQFDYRNGIDPNTGQQYPRWPFNSALSSNFPDWPLFVTAFGVPQCYFSPLAMLYRNNALARWVAMKKAWGGSCFGFAIATLLAFDDSSRFRQRFPTMPAFENLFSVPLDPAVRRIVNELWIHQTGTAHRPHVVATWNTKTPTQTVNELKQLFWNNDVDPVVLVFGHNGPRTGAHAIVPYKLTKDPLNSAGYLVHVYDNSYHDRDTARISVDTSANGNLGAWTYSLWPGWGGNKKLILTDRASSYYGLPGLGRPMPSMVAGIGSIQLYPTSDASVIVTDPNGNRIGYADSVLIEEIPGAVPLIPATGSLTPPYSYYLPDGAYRVVMYDFADSVAQLSIFTDSTVFTYNRTGATLAQTDRFAYDGSLGMRNADAQSKSVTVSTIFIIDSTAEKTYTISDCALTQNDSMRFSKEGDDDYRVVNTGPAKSYGLRIEYGSTTVGRLFIQPTVNLGAASSHIIVPNWNNLALPVRIYIDHGNNGTIDDSIFVQNTVDVPEQGGYLVPGEFSLAQNYPNPFNATTHIRYSIQASGFTLLKVYDVLGREVATLVKEVKAPGTYNVTWNADGMASGVYFYRLQAGEFTQTKRLMLLR